MEENHEGGNFTIFTDENETAATTSNHADRTARSMQWKNSQMKKGKGKMIPRTVRGDTTESAPTASIMYHGAVNIQNYSTGGDVQDALC
eukprot:5589725-Amphidinium_carterae.1